MLQGRPLYDNAADGALFVQPPEWMTLRRSVDRRVNVMLTGARGLGKTTLLRQLQRYVRESGRRAVYVDADVVTAPEELAARIRGAVSGQQAGVAETASGVFSAVRGQPLPPGGASRALYDDLAAINNAEAAVVLVDASGSGSAVHGIFGRMRDTLWQAEHEWVVAVDDSERATALAPPADAFFDVLISLATWEPDNLQQLLIKRAPTEPPRTVELIAQSARGNPRAALQALSRLVVSDLPPDEWLEQRAALETRAARLGRPQSMLLAELLDRGQGGPSDEDLQAALGVTRPRLAQLFGELQETGIVVQEVAKPDGPGRPRTVYRPRLPQ